MATKIFDRLGMKRPQYSAFDLSREQKLTAKMGLLIPTYLEEVVPGDQFMVRTETLLRMMPMLSPIMHRVNMYLHYFYVPNRLVWTEWERFITGGQDGEADPTFPVVRPTTTSSESGTLWDYLGLPSGDYTNIGTEDRPLVSQLPFRAYNLIVREYYRDENLVAEGFNPQFSGYSNLVFGISDPLLTLKRRSWEKDYFSSALPFAQRGPEVGVSGDVNYMTAARAYQEHSQSALNDNIEGAPDGFIQGTNSLERARIENIEDLNIDINDLRRSSALQRWLEKSARGGYRYIETILSHFGRKVPDHRLQRPEYLGGGRQPIQISEVLNTSNTAEHPQGDMTGHGISAGQTNQFRKSFDEHGYVMGIFSVMPNPNYFQGIPRHYDRRSRFDYYWPEFANLGEQEIKNQEIYALEDATPEERQATFGYQQRYAEYKYGTSTIHGKLRSNLEHWHLARKFDGVTPLNKEFVELSEDELEMFNERIFADSEEDNLIVQMYHNVKARRPMPYFSDPRLT